MDTQLGLILLFAAQVVVQFVPTIRQAYSPEQVEGYRDETQGDSESDAVGRALGLPIEITVFHQFCFLAVQACLE